jgi:hypothetical protein
VGLRKGPKRKAGKHREPVHRVKKLPVKSRTPERKLEQQQAKAEPAKMVWLCRARVANPREAWDLVLLPMMRNPAGSSPFASAQRTN